MKTPERLTNEGLVEYAERLSELYSRSYRLSIRKPKGQFFTHKQVSTYMAALFEVNGDTMRLLDPGAGTGILTAAFCERLLSIDKKSRLTIDAYENDSKLLPFLERVLESCKRELERKGHSVEYNIFAQDFILHNSEYFGKPTLFFKRQNSLYDFVISNPPYYKLNKDSAQSMVMKELVSGQPNIYALFMALSASMTKSEGEMVFITPRSFCSGLYYKEFRKWFLSTVRITNIHIFESRKEIFDKDEVLQENVIIKARKLKKATEHDKVIITISKGKDLSNLKKIETEYQDVVFTKNGEDFIRIPTSPVDVEVLHFIDSWPYTLKHLGLEISTGPVVPFRAKQYLLPEVTKHPKSFPLLWMHNMKHMTVAWPLRKGGKPLAIISNGGKKLLLPVKNYVLVKRFSSKEQRRRLYASVLLKLDFPHENVGIENHVNYIHKPRGTLSVYEAFGIAAILNTGIVDNFFRSLNGNTQVNATDIRSLPLPSSEDIKRIGKSIYKSKGNPDGIDLDSIVADSLGVNLKIMNNVGEK